MAILALPLLNNPCLAGSSKFSPLGAMERWREWNGGGNESWRMANVLLLGMGWMLAMSVRASVHVQMCMCTPVHAHYWVCQLNISASYSLLMLTHTELLMCQPVRMPWFLVSLSAPMPFNLR
eukprot:1144854-Pelagomonas_calceolata.AAC.3